MHCVNLVVTEAHEVFGALAFVYDDDDFDSTGKVTSVYIYFVLI